MGIQKLAQDPAWMTRPRSGSRRTPGAELPIGLDDLPPLEPIRVTISRRITNEAAKKTLRRLFMSDKAVSSQLTKREKAFLPLEKGWGGTIRTKHPNKLHLDLAIGDGATLKVKPQVKRDIRSVEEFVSISLPDVLPVPNNLPKSPHPAAEAVAKNIISLRDGAIHGTLGPMFQKDRRTAGQEFEKKARPAETPAVTDPIILSRMPLTINQRVLHWRVGERQPDEVLPSGEIWELLRTRAVMRVFVDRSEPAAVTIEEVLHDATGLFARIAEMRTFPFPVIVGPLLDDDDRLAQILAGEDISWTRSNFTKYCAQVARQWELAKRAADLELLVAKADPPPVPPYAW